MLTPVTHDPVPGRVIRGTLYGLYRSLRREGIPVGDIRTGFHDRDGDRQIQAGELRQAMTRDRVVLSLRHQDTNWPPRPGRSPVAANVAMMLDAADGRQDGYVDFPQPTGRYANRQSPWGIAGTLGRMSQSELADRLSSGEIVIGTRLMARQEARRQGYDVVELNLADTTVPPHEAAASLKHSWD